MIREEGPQAHLGKRGTPTMGGTVFIVAALVGYAIAHLATTTRPTVSGALVLFLMTGLGVVGFVDDYIKVFKQRSLGLRSGVKTIGIVIIGVIFALLSLRFPNGSDIPAATTRLACQRDFRASSGRCLFVPWPRIMSTGASNAVNLTGGLDGLAAGAVGKVLGA